MVTSGRLPAGADEACSRWRLDDKDLYGGLIRLHVLHHASQGPIFGLWIIEELREHGYRLSPGTLYPMLHAMATKGYLRSTEVRQGRHTRRVYRITPLGRAALRAARKKVRELFGELFEESERSRTKGKARPH
jgi:DNA-binding PadR family transcriptional regulator